MATYTRTYGAGNDSISPSDGYSLYVIDGGAGTDTLFVDARSTGFTISTMDATGVTTVSGASGSTLQLTNVEKISFKDGRSFTLQTLADVPATPGSVTGTAGNDAFSELSANQTYDGGDGIDTLQVGQARASATLTKSAGGWTLSGAAIGTDTLLNVERLQFSDGVKLALDVEATGNAGKAVQCIGTVAPGLKADPGTAGLILGMVDAMGVKGVFQWAIDQGVIGQLAQGNGNLDVARLAYQSIVGVAPDAATAQSFAAYMDNGMSQADFLTWASGYVDLAGIQTTGIVYL